MFKSNIEPLSNSKSVVPVISNLFTSKYCGLPPLFFTYNPGLLSITCSPGYNKIVVLSNLSLFCPDWYENLADSINALWIVTKGLVKEFPLLSKLSVASRSDGFTYRILPSVLTRKFSNLERASY